MTDHFENLLRQTLAEFLGDDASSLGLEDNLFEVGLDSISLLRVVNRLRRDSIEVDFAGLAENPTLAAWIHTLGASEVSETPTALAPAADDALMPLGTMQHAYWVGRSPGQRLGGVAAHLYVEFDQVDTAQDWQQDPDYLHHAFTQLMQRHASLRTKVTVDGHQQIIQAPKLPFTVYNLRDLSAEDRNTRLEQLRHDFSHQSLDVERGEVFCAALSLLPDGATRLHIDVDMIAADAVSYRILIADLVALLSHKNATLPDLSLSYRDYLIGVQPHKTAAAADAEAAWSGRLQSLPGSPILPETLLSADAAADPKVTRRHMWFTPEQKATLFSMAQRHGVTPAMTVATILAEVVGRWSATKHFLLNVPMFDRPAVHSEIDKVVGDFSSSIMLEVDLRQPASFLERVRALQARMHKDATHAAYSGLDVLRGLGRMRGETVLAPVVFTSALGLGELFSQEAIDCLGQPAWVISQGPQVLLDAQITEFNQGILVNWDIREEALAAGVADAMFAQFERWLTAVVDAESTWHEALPVHDAPCTARSLQTESVRIVDANGVDCPAHVVGQLEHNPTLWARADEAGTVQILGEETDGELSHYVQVNGVPVWQQDVERAIRTDPRIREVATVVRPEGFAAVVVFETTVENMTGKTLRAELARRVPAHLLPERIVIADDLPRVVGGTWDTAALLDLIQRESGTREVVAPTRDLEQVIADIWAQVLGLETIGINEEFIALGGDSLLATRVVARLQEELDTAAITLRVLFQFPTVAELIAYLETEDDIERLNEIAALTMDIRNMSDEEVAALLAEEDAAAASQDDADMREPVLS